MLEHRGLVSIGPSPTLSLGHVSPIRAREECPGDTIQCPSSLGPVFVGICCARGQQCALDDQSKPACCPIGLKCTGIAPTSPGAVPTAAPTYVSNSYFPFPYAGTTFTDRNACSAAVTTCSKNYDTCVTKVQQGDGYAVTIAVPGGGGKTVTGPAKNVGGPEATSICSSIRSQACGQIEATGCQSFPNSSASNKPPTVISISGSVVLLVHFMLILVG